jgi:hypothetical protein
MARPKLPPSSAFPFITGIFFEIRTFLEDSLEDEELAFPGWHVKW